MTCQKIPYDSRDDALTDANLIRSQQIFRSKKYGTRKKAGKKLYVYYCYYCKKHHLSSMKKRIKQ